MSATETPAATRTPTVYFIDDSATMREVIKIAFRKENMHVITCADASSALAQFAEKAPDAVITDVIMPDKDGYEVCQYIKQSEQLGRTPVILMSGVVNRAVAEKATAVRADELIRKPFQPHDLVARVKALLAGSSSSLRAEEDTEDAGSSGAAKVLSGLFAPAAPPAHAAAPRAGVAAPPIQRPSAPPTASAAAPQRPAAATAEVQRLKNEIVRLELLVKKLQASLEAEREYCAALEAHLKNPPGSE